MLWNQWPRPAWKRYAFSLLFVILSSVTRLMLLDTIGVNAPFVTYYPAVVLAALYGGFLPGILATFLSAFSVSLFLLEPIGQPFVIQSFADQLSMVVFIFSCTLISISCEKMHCARLELLKRTTELTEANSRLTEESSKREMAELGLKRLDRLNMVGQMAASISHEIRNPMTTVRGYLQMLSRRQDYQEQHTMFTLMIEELDRANSIITEYLSLARNKRIELVQHDLNKIIQSIYPLLSADANEKSCKITLKLNPLQDLLIDENEIRQLVINLVRNSVEAIEHNGCIFIETYMENNCTVLAVQDDGPGIPTEILDSLGTPFITTKSNGNGLGIPVCFQIAERHNAKISVISGAGGTTFSVKFQDEPGSYYLRVAKRAAG